MTSLVTRARRVYRKQGFRRLVTKAVRWFRRRATVLLLSTPGVDHFCLYASRRRLRDLMRSEVSLEGVLETAYAYRGFGNYRLIAPYQDREELHLVAEKVAASDPDIVLEIGTGRGGTLYVWARHLCASRIITVDYSLQTSKMAVLFDAFSPTTSIEFVRGYSQNVAPDVRAAVGDEAVDFLFLDGDPTYEGVKREFELYAPLVAEGGVIAVHDIVEDHPNVDEEKHRFWSELVEEYETEELVVSGERRKRGVGFVYL